MRQKVALTAAHLLCVGKVADMGMGSGAGSEALAALYPGLNVVGVDLDPNMVDMARERYRRENLTFERGDIAERVFDDATLDGIFDSSVLHHVTSYGGYVYANAERAIRAQVSALKPHGVLVVRDFLVPVDPIAGDSPNAMVMLDLPDDDGIDQGPGAEDPRQCSTAALMRRFAREFRSLHAQPGCEVREAEEAPDSARRRFHTTLRLAVEFVLRKDYRQDWEMEAKEEYTYFSQAEFEEIFARLGLRTLASTPLRNPWVVKNRFEGKFRLASARGEELEPPATNYLIAGERVPAGEGVRMREMASATPLGFLQMTHYRSRRSDAVRDLVRRPNMTFDVIPHFTYQGDVFVIGRMSYPRPILASELAHPAIDGSLRPHYVTEPLSVIAEDKPLGQTVEETLAAIAKIDPAQIHAFREGSVYYPSPGGSQEEVRSVFVEIDPVFVEEQPGRVQASGVSTSGRLRAIEAEQVLRAAQVGGLPDARLELNVYDLFLRTERAPGPWIGESIELHEGVAPEPAYHTTLAALHERPARREFVPASAGASHEFLTLRAGAFEEHDASGRVLATVVREYVLPRALSTNTTACALLLRAGNDVLLGVDDDDLPAAQCFTGNSQILVAPAWRLPTEVRTVRAARTWTTARIEHEYGVRVGRVGELGGRYHPSAGLSPELVFPLAVEVLDASHARRLVWFPLRDIAKAHGRITDGHLRIVALRAAHALSFLAES